MQYREFFIMADLSDKYEYDKYVALTHQFEKTI